MDALRTLLLDVAEYGAQNPPPSVVARRTTDVRPFRGEYRERLAALLGCHPQVITRSRKTLSPEWAGPICAALVATGADELRVREAAALDLADVLDVSVDTARKVATEALASPMWMHVLCYAVAPVAGRPVPRERVAQWCVYASR